MTARQAEKLRKGKNKLDCHEQNVGIKQTLQRYFTQS